MILCDIMAYSTVEKSEIVKKLRGFSKESHAASLASGIMRTCKDGGDIGNRIACANAVAGALLKEGVTSFYAAEYAKIYSEPGKAIDERRKLAAHFRSSHDLNYKQANKMADCIVFCAAKGQTREDVGRLAGLATIALGANIPFAVVADAVYYGPHDLDPQSLARRIIGTSLKQGKPLSISETGLAATLAGQ